MEAKFAYPVILCPLHEDQSVQKIDSNPDAKQMLYCIECVIDASSQNTLPSNLTTLDKFVSAASLYYSVKSQDLKPNPDVKVPPEFLDVLSTKGENLSRLEECTKKEKKSIEDVFSHLTVVLVEKINQKKREYLQMVEEQMANACSNYALFEKQLKRTYPKAEDVAVLFPSKTDLQARLKKVATASELKTFVNDIAEDMQKNSQDKKENNDLDLKKEYLTSLSKFLSGIDYSASTFEVNDLATYDLEVSIKESLSKFLDKNFILKDSISKYSGYPTSSLVVSKDWMQIHVWLDKKYKLAPKLLYQSKADGLTANAFHTKCDNKGPTITFIKCNFAGSSKNSIIGGFTNKDWNQGGQYVPSNENFIFSLTTRVKCPISQQEHGIYCNSNYGPTFGGGHDIGIPAANFTACYANPNSYTNATKIVDPENYAGGRRDFTVQEVEVYKVM